MRYRFVLLILGFTALGTAGTTTVTPATATTTDHVKFAAGGTIRLPDASGYITVEGWDKDEVEVTVVRSVGFDTEPSAKAKERLDAVRVATERHSDTELVVTTARPPKRSMFKRLPWKEHEVMVEYRIHAPRKSNLVIGQRGGNIFVVGMTGDVEAASRRGDIVLDLPNLAKYSIDAHTKLGVVSSDVAIGDAGGIPSVAAAAPQLRLKMRFGGITLKDMPSEAVTPAN